MKRLLSISLLSIVALFACKSTSSSSNEEPRAVNIIYTDWSEGVAISFLVKNVLESELEYDVTMKLADLKDIYPTVAKGEYDLFLDSWLPVTHAEEFAANQDKITKAGQVYEGAVAGLVAPDYFPFDSLSQLNQINPLIIGIDSTSGVVRNTIRAAEQYGFEPNIKTGKEAEMVAYLDDGFKRRKPFVITGWKPHQMFSKYNLKFLVDDKGVYGDQEGIYAVANKEKISKDLILEKFLERFTLTDRQISKLIQEVHSNPEGVDAGAKEWMRKHKIIVSRWTKNLSEFHEKAL